MASNTEGEMALPLCLPNNYKWDSERRKCIKTGEERSSLYVVKEALQQLKKIKGPVCVVSVAGTYRKGKSYILSEAFDQPQVFPLGHEFLPETVGVWIWILPDKHEDSKGQTFSVVLLDTEGIDSAMGEGSEDNQIFTLTVLLSSVLIFNTQGVPTRRDIEDLYFIANLSQRIHIRSNTSTNVAFGDADIFDKIFPFFIWLLRDVTLALPSDCKDIKEYFITKVFQEQKTDRSKKVVGSILTFFPGFDAFALPPPTDNPIVLRNISDNWNQLNLPFRNGLKHFKDLLKNTLAPKNSFNDEEFVSGEGLAQLVELYIDAINTPGAIPNVQDGWTFFVEKKCSDAKKAALKKYNTSLTSNLSGKLPCDSDEIRNCHDGALAECENWFMAETVGLSTDKVEDCLIELQTSIDASLKSWYMTNANATREFCNDLTEQLKKLHLDPVLHQLKGNEAVQLSFLDITNAYDKLKEDYEKLAIGAKDVIATVFFELNLKLNEEMELYLKELKRLKDYDDRLAQERAARAFQEQEMARLQEQKSQLIEENDNCRKQMERLIVKQNEENKRFRQQMENRDKQHQQQIKDLGDANEKTLRDLKKENYDNSLKLNREIFDLKQENQKNLKELKWLSERANEAPSKGQPSVESTNTSVRKPAETPSRRPVSDDSAGVPSASQGTRIQRRTAATTSRIKKTEETRKKVNAVRNTSFRDALLNTISASAAAIGAAVSVAVPAVAPIVAPVAAVVSSGAQVLKKCSIM